ncbi:hypothetical protein SASPL_136306 [Salvia splendens]|uniref:Uncharacterized protein n=2 Tax=Salvia splendens TaxID=180675 RepID=A0A8X8ZHE6_SALSN|nr:hypothetical protein SASPL_136306 [Salvia splendens]
MSKAESSESPPPPPKADHHDAGEKAPPKVDHHDKAPPPPAAPPDDDDDDDECSSISSSPSYKSSKKPPKPEPTQPPPSQEMERSPSAYRIPPSVFERNKSSAAGDWSIASNDSLFSIHVGNMSFTNDQYMWGSDELTPPPPDTAGGDHMFSYPAHSSNEGVADMRSSELGLAEATMLEVIKENEGRSPPPRVPVPAEVRKARRSAGSNQSNMSFAFAVAGGETERIPSSIKSPEKTPVEPQQHDEPIEKEAQPPPSK